MKAYKILGTLMIALSNSMISAQAPLGASWGPTYGFPPYQAEAFMPELRRMGASFSRITLYWSQLEPKKDAPRWNDLDAYLGQLHSSGEGMLTLASASPWAAKSHAWVFPSSMPTDLDAYYEFVYRVVTHAKGRIRFFQCETEPNNPFFWAGSATEYAILQKVFYKAVKAADPGAQVVLAGSDGLFDPTGGDPLPGEDAGVAFFKTVLREVGGAFDIFDLHLYGDPYTIPARVKAVQSWMRETGEQRPIIASEYAGPTFFEFKANRRWFAELQGPSASPIKVRQLRETAATLPVETRMFLLPEDPELSARLLRLQMKDMVVRNLLALSSGIARTGFFSIWQNTAEKDSPHTILFGSFSLLDHAPDGALTQRHPLAAAFVRLAEELRDTTHMERLPIAEHPDVFIFRVQREHRRPLLVAWRRSSTPQATAEPVSISVPWSPHPQASTTIAGERVSFVFRKRHLTFPVGDMPVLLD